MRCYICNSILGAEEVHYDTRYEDDKHGPYSPCAKCLFVIDEAFEDPINEEEVDFILNEDVDQIPQEEDGDVPF